ncbi:MAG: RagB/SusD family nutrient uptake outer membrane protein [Tannerella sp.]|jgi:hypothetical protein|nr:RagB/SusD family nutrient uptake outer membrane protein [Tannerella sp.]
MKKTSFLLSIILTIGIFSGCDNLKYNEVDIFDEAWMFENQVEVSSMLGTIYAHTRHGLGTQGDSGLNGAMLASATDESDFSFSLSTIHRYYNGAWSSVNAFPDTWTNSYAAVFKANNFLERLDRIFATLKEYEANQGGASTNGATSVAYATLQKRFELFPYQARFLRAYFHFELAKTYGNVPLVTRTVSPEDANQLTPSSVQEVFQFIVDECDAIMEFLPISYADQDGNQIGRVNRPTVLALKARTLLYAASPLFSPANPKEAWRKAAIACKELIDNAEGWGIALSSYANIWATNNYYANPEVIWFRGAGNTRDYAMFNYPVGFEGAVTGGNCPSQNLVDAYEYSNSAPEARKGKTFAEVNPTVIPANAYQNLDPRFGLTVAKNGDTWPTVAPYSDRPLETFEGGISGPPVTNATTTGYYLKKYINGGNRLVNPVINTQYTWITYRLGEFYLDYAEAMFNYMDRDATATGEGILDMSANDAINVLRSRPGIDMPLFGSETNGDVWEERYMRERMVELAFEGHRFWDIRRWKKGAQLYSNIKTIRVTRDGTVTRGTEINRGTWDDKFYFYPIPFGELQKAQGLTQNPGW